MIDRRDFIKRVLGLAAAAIVTKGAVLMAPAPIIERPDQAVFDMGRRIAYRNALYEDVRMPERFGYSFGVDLGTVEMARLGKPRSWNWSGTVIFEHGARDKILEFIKGTAILEMQVGDRPAMTIPCEVVGADYEHGIAYVRLRGVS